MIHLGHILAGTALAWAINKLFLDKGATDETLLENGDNRTGGDNSGVERKAGGQPDGSGGLAANFKKKGETADENTFQPEKPDTGGNSAGDNHGGKPDGTPQLREAESLEAAEVSESGSE